MKTFFNYAMIFMATVALSASLVACSDDDDDKDQGGNSESTIVDNAKYKDKSYGNEAIDACASLVNELESANSIITQSKLTETQEQFLRDALRDLVNNVIIPTYTDLADDVEDLEKTLNGLTATSITQTQINEACDDFKDAREEWERSEAFLMGAASEFDIDPTIDSWPLNRTLLVSYFNNGMNDQMLEDATILGFHALEFILFRNGQPRKAEEFKGNDTFKNFEKVSGEKELKYAQTICKLLKERCFQLEVAWEGETAANAGRMAVVKAAGLDYTTANGLSFGVNLYSAGNNSMSTFPTLKSAIAQVLSDDEGSCVGIANEVGTAKIANPFSAGDISYVESPYSYNSITDFQDNIRSIRNIWFGSTNGKAASKSFATFFDSVNTQVGVEAAFNRAIEKIGNMPAPFVKYCSTVWNKEFIDDEDWD